MVVRRQNCCFCLMYHVSYMCYHGVSVSMCLRGFFLLLCRWHHAWRAWGVWMCVHTSFDFLVSVLLTRCGETSRNYHHFGIQPHVLEKPGNHEWLNCCHYCCLLKCFYLLKWATIFVRYFKWESKRLPRCFTSNHMYSTSSINFTWQPFKQHLDLTDVPVDVFFYQIIIPLDVMWQND